MTDGGRAPSLQHAEFERTSGSTTRLPPAAGEVGIKGRDTAMVLWRRTAYATPYRCVTIKDGSASEGRGDCFDAGLVLELGSR